MRPLRLYDPKLDCAYQCSTRLHRRHSDFTVEDFVAFREALDAASVFGGVEVLAFALLPRRIELLVKVEARRALDDSELLRRARAGLGEARAEALGWTLAAHSPRSAAGREARSRLTKRMFDLRAFMKDLLQRCSHAYLSARNLKGAVWANVYASMPVENRREVLAAVAASVDAWAVWEGGVRKAEQYPFCGLGEAAAGSPAFRGQLRRLCGERSWAETLRAYRKEIGALERPRRRRNMPRVHGDLPAEAMLRAVREKCRREQLKVIQRPKRGEDELLRALRDYRKRFGDCLVSSKWKEDPSLGRWVLTLRERREAGLLGAPLVAKLDTLGFQWERARKGPPGVPGGRAYVPNRDNINARWEAQFQNLLAFLAAHGHTRVPRGRRGGEGNHQLALWIMIQREKQRNGEILPERKARLDAIGFDWEPHK